MHGDRTVGERRLPRRLGTRALRPAQQRVDTGHHLLRAEGLGDVVVGAELQPDDAVHLVGAGGDHDHGQVGEPVVVADVTADFEPVHAGQHAVEDDEVGAVRMHPRQRVGAVADGVHVVVGTFEVVPQEVSDVRVVLDDEDLLFHLATV